MRSVSRLPNGLVVVTQEMPQMTSVSLGIWVGVGGRHEPASLSGVSHFIEHMLFKGTQRRSALRISQDVEGIGGYLNAFTTEECTCFYSKACHDRFPELLDVLMDMFLHSKFDSGEIDKERNVIKEELAMYLDQPHQQVQELLNETLWPNHPLGRSLTGTEATLDALNRSHLRKYQRDYYTSGATIIAAAGNLKHSEVVSAVKRYSRQMPAGGTHRFVPASVVQTAPRIRLHTKRTEQTQLALGVRTCSRHDERRFALRLLNTILGENTSSRLFQVVREEHGLAYSVASSLGYYQDTGVLNIAVGLETGRLEKALKLIITELRRLVRTPVPTGELRRARDYVIGQMELSLENTESQMMWIAEQWLGYGRIFSPDEITKRLTAIKPSDIQATAMEFLRPERLNLALVSPLKKADRLQSALARVSH